MATPPTHPATPQGQGARVPQAVTMSRAGSSSGTCSKFTTSAFEVRSEGIGNPDWHGPIDRPDRSPSRVRQAVQNPGALGQQGRDTVLQGDLGIRSRYELVRGDGQPLSDGYDDWISRWKSLIQSYQAMSPSLNLPNGSTSGKDKHRDILTWLEAIPPVSMDESGRPRSVSANSPTPDPLRRGNNGQIKRSREHSEELLEPVPKSRSLPGLRRSARIAAMRCTRLPS